MCHSCGVFFLCLFVGGVGLVGYSRSGGLWQTETSLLPRHRRHPHVLLYRQPWQFRYDHIQNACLLSKTARKVLGLTGIEFQSQHPADFSGTVFQLPDTVFKHLRLREVPLMFFISLEDFWHRPIYGIKRRQKHVLSSLFLPFGNYCIY